MKSPLNVFVTNAGIIRSSFLVQLTLLLFVGMESCIYPIYRLSQQGQEMPRGLSDC